MMGRENPTPEDRSRSSDIILRALKWLASTSEGDKSRLYDLGLSRGSRIDIAQRWETLSATMLHIKSSPFFVFAGPPGP